MDIFGTKTRALEVLSVFRDVKPCARMGFYNDEIPKAVEFCEKNNLSIVFSEFKVLLLDKYKGYSDKGIKVTMDDPNPGMIFAYISKEKEKAVKAKYFEEINDQYNLGLILGYPLCCVEFFVNNYEERSKIDNDYTVPAVMNSKEGSYSFLNNTLLREEDTTLLFHFPCSFNCVKSEEIGKKHFEILKEADSEMANIFSQRLRNWFTVEERNLEFD